MSVVPAEQSNRGLDGGMKRGSQLPSQGGIGGRCQQWMVCRPVQSHGSAIMVLILFALNQISNLSSQESRCLGSFISNAQPLTLLAPASLKIALLPQKHPPPPSTAAPPLPGRSRTNHYPTMSATDPKTPPGDAAPEILEERIWIDGCFDFFHHGEDALG
jgi:hypothetical protein